MPIWKRAGSSCASPSSAAATATGGGRGAAGGDCARAETFGFDWSLDAADAPPRVLIAVSKGSHCLNDCCIAGGRRRWPVDIAGVVSNHDSLRPLVEWHGLPWHHLPVDDTNRDAQEAAILALMAEARADYLILARYMQVLGPRLVEGLAGRCINIHHSFLPGFKGAQPYHRAHARGVKLIGATAHFVTADLDEGPIIEQAVERVDHRASVDDLIRIGTPNRGAGARTRGRLGGRAARLPQRQQDGDLPMTLQTVSTAKAFGGTQGVYTHTSATTGTADDLFCVRAPA